LDLQQNSGQYFKLQYFPLVNIFTFPQGFCIPAKNAFFPIVPYFNVFEYLKFCFLDCFEFSAIHKITFNGLEKAFCYCMSQHRLSGSCFLERSYNDISIPGRYPALRPLLILPASLKMRSMHSRLLSGSRTAIQLSYLTTLFYNRN
jgi:hypothetical protein